MSLKNYRSFIGMTQREMASATNVSISTYAEKERDVQKFKLDEANTIFHIIQNKIPDITFEEIFFGDKVSKKYLAGGCDDSN